ncbi:hypothetical protein [Paenarthrobacter nicotinovorans]|uniref:hypothetical protein n=1 Tax=Paenarthrobacter nicotinovorans TaxID=29320 RepID=UPI003DA5CD7D
MNALTIKNPADLLSFIGHTLGFWPEESLVCITSTTTKLEPHSASIFPVIRATKSCSHGLSPAT